MDTLNFRKAIIILIITVGITTPVVSGIIVWRFLAYRLETLPHPSAGVNSIRIIKAEDVTPFIAPGKEGIAAVVPGWQQLAGDKVDGPHDPSAPPGHAGCFGLAWHVNGHRNIVFVFQDKRELKFGMGGWYALVQMPADIQITAADVGKIQADWLAKNYGGSWTVLVVPPGEKLDGVLPQAMGR